MHGMEEKIGSAACIPNPALQPLQVLVGEWQTSGSHPYLPDTPLHGRASFAWIEGGAFLLMRTECDNPNIPSGVAIFGSDDGAQRLFLLYFDERGISRLYNVSVTDDQITWWRDDPSFSQCFSIVIAEDDNTLLGQGEMSREGAAWEKDITMTYRRVM